MPTPTFVAEYELAWNSATTPKTVSVTVADGDGLLIVGMSADDGTTLNTPTGGTGLTYTLLGSSVVVNYCTVYMWGVTVGAGQGQTFTLSMTKSGASDWWGGNALRYSSFGGWGTPAKTNNSTGTPSLSISTVEDNSSIVVANGDFNAVDGTTRTWRTVNGSAATEQTYFRDASWYGVYIGRHIDAGTLGAKTVGLSAPTGQKWNIQAVEVKGVSSGAFNGTASVSPTATITASGVVDRNTTAAVSETASITAAGSTGVSRTAAVDVTATITATGSTGVSQTAPVSPSASITATGTTGVTQTAPVNPTTTIAATGTTGLTQTAPVSVTATISATGTITAAGTGSATVTPTVTITASGTVATSSTAPVAPTITIDASGQVGKVGVANTTATATITAAGSVTSGVTADRSTTATITAAGVVGTNTTASVGPTLTITAAGQVATSKTAAVAAICTITATGTVFDPSAQVYNLTARAKAAAYTATARTPSYSGRAKPPRYTT